MINTIGETAGQIYNLLDEKGEQTVTKIKKEIDVDDFTLNAAIGWLAREDNVIVEKGARSVKVSLK